MSWLSSAFKKVSLKNVVKIAAPLAVGALGIPAVGAGVAGMAMKAAGALGSLQRRADNPSTTPASIAGDAGAAYLAELNKPTAGAGQTFGGKVAQMAAKLAGSPGTLLATGAAAVGGYLLLRRKPARPSYGRR